MGRRRKNDDDWIELVVKLGGFVILLGVITPQGRQFIAAIGALAVCALVLAVIGLIGFVIYRIATRSKRRTALDLIYGRDDTNPTRPALNLPRIGNDCQPSVGSVASLTTETLLEKLRAIDWFQFEKIVALAYQKNGYMVTRRGGANPDGGIDLIIEKDGKRLAVQCKQWKTWNVGVKAVREFLGALTDAGIQKGIFITMRGYTGDAKQLAEKHGIQIVNEAGLAQLLEATDANGRRWRLCPGRSRSAKRVCRCAMWGCAY